MIALVLVALAVILLSCVLDLRATRRERLEDTARELGLRVERGESRRDLTRRIAERATFRTRHLN